MEQLPDPICKWGYPPGQLEEILGDRMAEFEKWMDGQTTVLCEGREWNYRKKEYVSTGCGPHGVIVPRWDVERFVAGWPVL